MEVGRIVEEKIQEAMREGKFENLRGRGKPLVLRENPFEDPAWRMANDILEAGGFAPEWIELDRDLREGAERARVAMRRTLAWAAESRRRLGSRRDLEAERERDFIIAELRRARERFLEEIRRVNAGIANLNLKVPSDRLQRLKLDPAVELARLGIE